ncbi:hypothetical protein ACIPSE_36950 [Streptomyces sp. NPDC090106]|uniref:hypothetical protein n=1 Tax=Streptomyces sp. NPDC090106 TaxID=3365946 RepID=UPI0038196CA7
MGMEPVNMKAVDEMGADTAARSEQGLQNARDISEGFQEGRRRSFGQGFQEGRQMPAYTSSETY